MYEQVQPIHPYSWRSLQTRLTLLTLTVFLLSIWFLSFFASRALHNDLLELLGRQQQTDVTLHATAIQRTISERIRTLESATRLVSPDLMQNPSALQALLEERPALPFLFNGGFFVINGNGVAIASVPTSAKRVGVNYADREHIRAALHEGKSSVGRPLISRTLRLPVIPITAPIRNAQGKVIGAFVAAIDLSRTNFLDQIMSSRYGQTGGYVLIAKNWRLIVTATDKNLVYQSISPPGANPQIDQLLAGSDNAVVLDEFYGAASLVASQTIPAANWVLVSTLPIAEAFAPAHNLARNIALATLLASLAASTITWIILRRQLHPVHLAFQALLEGAQSQQPLQALPHTSQDEVGQLIQSFNALLQKLNQHEATLRQNETATQTLAARLHEAQRISQLGSWILDHRTHVLEWSPQVFHLFELDPARFIPTYESFLQAIHPDDRENVSQAFSHSIATQTPYEIEHRIPMRDGRIKWVLERCDTDSDAIGNPIRSIGTVQDITERKRAELALNDARTLLATVLDTIPLRVFWKNHDLVYLGCNTAFARDAGANGPDDLIGKTDFQLGWAVHASAYRMDDQNVIQTGTPKLFYEEPQSTPDGGLIWLRTSKVPLRNESGEVFGVLGMYEDITERKRSEDQIRILSMVAQQTLEKVVVTDLAANIEFVNTAFVQSTGYRREEVLGKNPRFLQSGQTPATVYQEMWQALLQGQTWSGELVNRHKDGAICTELATITPLRNHDGVVTHYVALENDITEQKKIADELTQHRNHLERLVEVRTAELHQAKLLADSANHSKSEFLANMSHEIRTPMNGIIGMVDILDQTSLTAEQKRMLATIEKSSKALLNILNDILDFSKIEAGKLSVEQVPTPLREVVEDAAQLMLNVASGKDAQISLFIDPSLPEWILCDPTRLRQILLNLLSNALKFVSGKSGHAIVNVQPVQSKHAPSRLHISISDNGIGMSKEVLDKLFEPFTQADSSTMRRFGGTGLGLSITHRLVELLQGKITVQSSVGFGSEFTVELPCLPTDPPLGCQTPARPDLQGIHVLAITRNRAHLTLFDVYLRSVGATVAMAPDWETAQARLQLAGAESARTVLLLDLQDDGNEGLASKPATDQLPRMVRLVRRGKHRPHHDESIAVPSQPLLYHDLLQAVAVAARRIRESRPNIGEAVTMNPPALMDAVQTDRLVLVAEDNETNCEVLQEQLRLLGYASEIATDGTAALELWRTGRFGLLLTDYHMPQMDGFALTAEIRRNEPPGVHLPIIAITANAVTGEAQRCREHGMDGYLSKPLRIRELRDVLTRWLPLDRPATPIQLVAEDPVHGPVSWSASALCEIVGPDVAAQHRLLRRFLRNAREQVDALITTQNDLGDLAIRAHTLKSAARCVGAMALGTLCAAIESASQEQNPERCRELVSDLPASLAEAETLIGRHLASSPIPPSQS